MKKNSDKRKNKAGFTLVELLLVMIIIATLAGIGLKNMAGNSGKAKRTKALANVTMLDSAASQFEIINGTFPSSLEEILSEGKGGPFLAKKVLPLDPNGRPFIYSNPGANNTHRIDISCEFNGESLNNWDNFD
jgi:general secretion pathway protein G